MRRRVLTRDDQVVPLRTETFELLLLLVRNSGRALSKQELMAALWPDTFVEEANLSFQISTLRKTLGETSSHWIETVPKHGYRFAVDVRPVAPTENVQSAPTASSPERRVRPTIGPWLAAIAVATLLIVGTYMTIASRRADHNQAPPRWPRH